MNDVPTMLIVEDNPDDLDLLKRAIRRAAIEVRYDVATDGDAAVEALERVIESGDRLPRVMLLDLKLPRRSGFEVLEWMKSNPPVRRVPVVVLTSSETSSDLARAYDLGANSYLVKPVSATALTEMVEQIGAYWLRLNAVA